jgi:hypothetical protein
LINKIIHKNQLIKQKLEYWLKKDKVNHNLINSWTIDLEKIVCYFVDQKIIPKIQILHNGGLIELQAKISVAGGNKEPLDKVKTFLFSK